MRGRDGRLSWLGDVITHIQDEAVGPAPSIEHVISRIMGAPDSDVALTLERKQGRLEQCGAGVTAATNGHGVAGESKRSPGQAPTADQVGALNLTRAMPAPATAGAPALAPTFASSPGSPPPSTTPVKIVASDPPQTTSLESQSAGDRGCEGEGAGLIGSQQPGARSTAAEAGAGNARRAASKYASSSVRPAMTFEEVLLLDDA